MLRILREIRVLRTEGRLHRRLLIRTRILLAISAILAAIVGFNIVARDVSAGVCAVLAAIGIILGIFVFSRMNVVQWNEEESVVQSGRMDRLGYFSLALYIAFEIGLRTFLSGFYPASATIFLLSGIFGTLLGRVIGTLLEIHRVYVRSHARSS